MHMEFKHNIYGDNDFETIDVYHEIVNPSNSHNCDIQNKTSNKKNVNKNICNEKKLVRI